MQAETIQTHSVMRLAKSVAVLVSYQPISCLNTTRRNSPRIRKTWQKELDQNGFLLVSFVTSQTCLAAARLRQVTKIQLATHRHRDRMNME